MRALIYILAFCTIAIAAGFAVRKMRSAGTIRERVGRISHTWIDQSGFSVRLEAGANVKNAELAAIEEGLQRTFKKAGCRGYSKKLNTFAYTVAIVKGEADSQGEPAFRVPPGAYAGTEWDKGGYMLVGGEVIDQNNALIVVPEHFGNTEHLARVIEYEAEHIVLYFNDRDEYERTKVNGVGTGHPIIPDCPAADLKLAA